MIAQVLLPRSGRNPLQNAALQPQSWLLEGPKVREKSMQNLLGHSAAWRGRGLKVRLPRWLWAGRPHRIRLGKRHSGQIVRFEGYKDFKVTAYFFTKTQQDFTKTRKIPERFQETSRHFVDACRLEPELRRTDECCRLEPKERCSDAECCVVVSV